MVWIVAVPHITQVRTVSESVSAMSSNIRELVNEEGSLGGATSPVEICILLGEGLD